MHGMITAAECKKKKNKENGRSLGQYIHHIYPEGTIRLHLDESMDPNNMLF